MILHEFKAIHSKYADTMRRDAYPLGAAAYRDMIDELQTNVELRERMPTAARVAIYAMLLCGLRIGEAVTMKSGWVSVSAGGAAIVVPSEVSSRGSGGSFRPKTISGNRSVPVPGDFTDHSRGEGVSLEFERVLKAYFVNHEEVNRGKECIRRWMCELALEAGVDEYRSLREYTFDREPKEYPDVIPHDLRASWCAQCLRSDVNRYTVRDWGGWADMSMINRYAKYVGDPSGEQIKRF